MKALLMGDVEVHVIYHVICSCEPKPFGFESRNERAGWMLQHWLRHRDHEWIVSTELQVEEHKVPGYES